MLTKISELNRNVIVLLSVAMIAVTSIVITLLIISGGSSGKTSAVAIKELQDVFVSEYGVKPSIDITVYEASEAQAKTITDTMSGKLKLNNAEMSEEDGTTWYSTNDDKGEIDITVFFD
jgi:hypothetical protein